MSLTAKIKDIEFGVGDKIRVIQKIQEGEKSHSSTFEGMVIAIRGQASGVSFIVRRTGEANIGIEKIFPLGLPSIDKIEIVKKGLSGVRRAKLYYTRGQSPKEIEEIYSRASGKNLKNARKKKH